MTVGTSRAGPQPHNGVDLHERAPERAPEPGDAPLRDHPVAVGLTALFLFEGIRGFRKRVVS